MNIVERAKDFLLRRQQSYRKVFDGPYGEVVLGDLAKFCRAVESTGHENPQVSARLDGRREVFLRIQQHLQLNQEELWALLSGDQNG